MPLTRIVAAECLADAVVGADIVIEAVREDLDTKLALFAELSRLAPDAILTTNSSSLPSSQIAPAVDGPRTIPEHALLRSGLEPAHGRVDGQRRHPAGGDGGG